MSVFRQLLVAIVTAVKNLFVFASKFAKEGSSNFTNNGCIQGPVYTGFAQSKYLQINTAQPTTSFDFVIKCNPLTSYGDLLKTQPDMKGILMRCTSSSVTVYLSSTGSSWNVLGSFNTGISLTANTDVYIKISWLSSTGVYTFYQSIDGINWTEKNSSSGNLAAPYWSEGNTQNIGGSVDYGEYWGGTVYLNDTYINIDGSIYFNGTTAIEGVNFTNTGCTYLENNTCQGGNGKDIVLPGVFPISDANSWSFKTKFTYMGGASQCTLLGYIDPASNNYKTPSVTIISNIIGLRINDGSLWTSTLTMVSGTTYWLDVGFTGTSYYIKAKTAESDEYTTYLDQSSTTKQNNTVSWMLMNTGYRTSSNQYYNNGVIDMSKTSLTINDSLYWIGITFPVQVGDAIKLNDGMGESNYLYEAYPEGIGSKANFAKDSIIKAISTDEQGNTVYSVEPVEVDTKTLTIQAGQVYSDYNYNTDNVYLPQPTTFTTDNDCRYTNNGCVKGPGYIGGSGKYLLLNGTAPLSTADSWEIKSKITYQGGGTYPCIFGTSGSDNKTPIIGHASGGNFQILLSSSGSGWGLYNGNVGLSMTTGSTYYIKVGFTGTSYYFWYSTVSFEDIGISNTFLTSSTKVYCSDPFWVLNSSYNSSNYYWNGSVDLSQTTIKTTTNGVETTFFDGSTAVEGTDFTNNGCTYLENNTTYQGGSGKYLIMPAVLPLSTADSWEFRTKYTYNGGGSNSAFILSNSNGYYLTPQLLARTNGIVSCYISSNGTSFDIASDTATTLTMVAGNVYYLQYGFDSSGYYLWYSTISFDDTEGIKFIINSDISKKVNCTSQFYLLNNGGILSSGYSNGTMDLSKTSFIIDGVSYLLGFADVTNQFYNSSFEPININAKLNQNVNNAIFIDNNQYDRNSSGDLIQSIDCTFDTQGDNTNYTNALVVNPQVTLNVDQNNSSISSSSSLTTSLSIIPDDYVYFDMEFLTDFSTKLLVGGQEFQENELPILIAKGNYLNYVITRNNTIVYNKLYILDHNLDIKKKTLTISPDVDGTTITTTINNFTTTGATRDCYPGDVVTYTVSKTGYKTETGSYTITYLEESTISVTMTPTYRFEIISTPVTANVTLTCEGYTQEDNYILVPANSVISWQVDSYGYTTQYGSYTINSADYSLSITLVASSNYTNVLQNSMNINNYGCSISDSIIAGNSSGRVVYSNGVYSANPAYFIANDAFPITDANTWEFNIEYEHFLGGTYTTILGPSTALCDCPCLYINTSNLLYARISNTGVTWLIDVSTGLTLIQGSKYRFSFGQTSNYTYYLDYSLYNSNTSTWSEKTRAWSLQPTVTNKKCICSVPMMFLNSAYNLSTCYSNGKINLSYCNLTIDGTLYWSALDTFDIDNIVVLNNGLGTSDYKWTANNNIDTKVSEMSETGKVISTTTSGTDTLLEVQPLAKEINILDIIADQDTSTITTWGDLPNSEVSLITNQDNANISSNSELDTFINVIPQGYRIFDVEFVSGWTYEIQLNGELLTSTSLPMIAKDNSWYTIIIKDDTTFVNYTMDNIFKDTLFKKHSFTINTTPANATVVLTLGNKSYTSNTTYCYSGMTINYQVSATGYINLVGSYTIPFNSTTNGNYNLDVELDPSVTLTVSPTPADSTVELIATGYTQVGNTITTKIGNAVLDGSNLQVADYINNGCTMTEEE